MRISEPGCDVESEITGVLYDVLSKLEILK